ncbi:MAG: sodium:proton antiporter [Ruminococcaceae bacterium]|nr:sodium:proton antiporter [Oscillospiraceae bacterium]
MILCFALFMAAVVACLVTGKSLVWAILWGLCLFFALGLRRGYSTRELFAMAWKKGKSALIVVPVFLMIGMVTGLWRSSGTISFFLYHGLKGIDPTWFVLMAFLLSAALSFALGTSYGVCGTAGVVLMTLARSGGVSIAVTAGAVISGAYFGDRCSPMSSCANLVAACTGTKLYSNVKEMLKTALLPTLLTIAFYGVLSVRNPITEVDAATLDALQAHFYLTWPVMIPVAMMLVLPLLKLPVKWAMTASAAAALLVSVLLQEMPLMDALRTAIFGFAPEQPELSILSGGGLMSMTTASVIVFVTSLYSGILEGIEALLPAKKTVDRLADQIGLFPAMTLVSALVVMVFCNQSVMVIMDEQLLGESYEKRGGSRMERAMDIANSGVTIAGLVPWSIAISVPLTMLGAEYSAVPFAALLYLIPLCYLFTRRFFLPSQRLWRAE